MTTNRLLSVGVLWRGDPHTPMPPEAEQNRLAPVIEALRRQGLDARAVLFSEDREAEVRSQLIALDGVLVWVDPIHDGRDRSVLDALLRDVAAAGVWVSAHPDVILKMGTKDVLVSTQAMEWGTECFRYDTVDDLRLQLPARLARGPRVLKQHRGNSGNGVWKVEAAGDAPGEDVVQILHAVRGSELEQLPFSGLVERFSPYFDGSGCMIDQPYQERLGEGMVRCYIVQDRVAGFGHQLVTALLPPPAGSKRSPLPPPRLYYGESKSEFQALKARLETTWIADMCRVLGLTADQLPALWDADFLVGPKSASGEDTYVLCEINVSSVLPFPDEALPALVERVSALLASRQEHTL